jgi:hypothetical protein
MAELKNRAVPGPVVVSYVRASTGEADPDGRLGDYNPAPPLMHDGSIIDVAHVPRIGWLAARSRQIGMSTLSRAVTKVLPTGDSGALSEAAIRVITDNVLSDKVRMNGLGTAALWTYGRMGQVFLREMEEH